MAEIGKDINKAKFLLERGELVAIPTETVYGLAANALNPLAVARIFEVKKRPYFDPLIVHISDIAQAELYAAPLPEAARELAKKFWPGPLTLLAKKNERIPDLVTAGLDTVALRCPNHSMTLRLLKNLEFPLAAPSANPFGYVSPTMPAHVQEQLGKDIDYILDGGPCDVGIESTIIGFDNAVPTIFRLGGLSLDVIEAVVGTAVVKNFSTSNPLAPGQLKSHYAPRIKLILGDPAEMLRMHDAALVGVLSFTDDFHAPHQIVLSRSGSLVEAAHNLFTALRELDKMPIDYIIAQQVPDTGLGKAINDRLQRAAAEG
ncbi:MAG TPA: L-threonylcarbamoyladenylate synthase [Chryseosolibacter sp.]|nr:L-threonylcarbamoyladenylate synthase [Chryseosolibacter sp.]